jgi:hypothetical protein
VRPDHARKANSAASTIVDSFQTFIVFIVLPVGLIRSMLVNFDAILIGFRVRVRDTAAIQDPFGARDYDLDESTPAQIVTVNRGSRSIMEGSALQRSVLRPQLTLTTTRITKQVCCVIRSPIVLADEISSGLTE